MENRSIRRKVTSQYSLMQLAEELGYSIKKVSRNHYSLMEHPSVMINRNKNTFQRFSNGAWGDGVAFLMSFGEHIDTRFKSVDYSIRYLEKQLSITPGNKVSIRKEVKHEIKPLELPERDINNNQVIKYLHEERCIDKAVIDYFIDKKMLYQERWGYRNCVFVSYKDGIPVFASKRSSTSNFRFCMEFSENNYDYCIFVDNNSSTLIVTESFIDMMSVITLSSIEKIYMKQSFLSINSVTKYNAIIKHLSEKSNIKTVVLALDNDEAGLQAIYRIKEEIAKRFKTVKVIGYPPGEPYKDWNDVLKDKVRR